MGWLVVSQCRGRQRDGTRTTRALPLSLRPEVRTLDDVVGQPRSAQRERNRNWATGASPLPASASLAKATVSWWRHALHHTTRCTPALPLAKSRTVGRSLICSRPPYQFTGIAPRRHPLAAGALGCHFWHGTKPAGPGIPDRDDARLVGFPAGPGFGRLRLNHHAALRCYCDNALRDCRRDFPFARPLRAIAAVTIAMLVKSKTTGGALPIGARRSFPR